MSHSCLYQGIETEPRGLLEEYGSTRQNRRNPRQGIETCVLHIRDVDEKVFVRIDEIPVRGLKLAKTDRLGVGHILSE